MSKWANVARIAKPRKEQGSLTVQSADGLPLLLSPGMQVWFVPPTLKGPRTAYVDKVRQLKGGTYAVSFDIDIDEKDAQDLVGHSILALKSDLPHEIDDGTPVGLIGWTVRDEELGPLGRVADVAVRPYQSLLEVEGLIDGAARTTYIPVVDEFIVSLDEVSQELTVRIPRGLVGLNGPDGGEGPADKAE